MGAQQMKPYDERLIEHNDKQQNLALSRITNEIISQHSSVGIKRVMQNQSISSVSSPTHSITVADFAKIKKESSCTLNDSDEFDTLINNIKIEHQNICDRSDEDASVVFIPESFEELKFLDLPSMEPKQELLLAYGEDSGKSVIQNGATLALSCKSNEEIDREVQFPLQSAIEVENQLTVNSVAYQANNKSKDMLLEEENDEHADTNFDENIPTLVKNPFAFLNKTSDKHRDQVRCSNVTTKSDPTAADEELETQTPINAESKLQTTILNELLIKSEDPFISETNEESLKNDSLYQTALGYNPNSSLDVNLSHESTDIDEVSSKHLPEDEILNISLNTTPQSMKYFSTFEISSDEDNMVISRLNKMGKTIRKRKANKGNNNKDYKPGKTRKFQYKQIKSCQERKRLGRPKTKNYLPKHYNEKDSEFKISLTKRNDFLKKLPKRSVQPRRNTKKWAAKKSYLSSKVELPKPLKLETATSQKDRSVPVELPKPMLFKSELAAYKKNKHSYLQPEFQPIVRLKRMKSEELLIPLRTKRARRPRKFKAISETRRDFLIKQAYSLNPSIKYNHLSMDTDQRLLGSRYATTCSILTDMQNESIGEVESKYCSAQDALSTFSGSNDSGVATSTPCTAHRKPHNCNKSLLLQLAAERAFINNHLMYFGHSPIQFDLYNNLYELTIFLKYLLGNMNTN